MLSSTGKAAEWVGGKLGEFVYEGVHQQKPYFVQRDDLGEEVMYLYYSEGGLRIGSGAFSVTSALEQLDSATSGALGSLIPWRSFSNTLRGYWYVNNLLGESAGFLRNQQDTEKPPTANWEYSVRGRRVIGIDQKGRWNDDDDSITAEFTALEPCGMVRVVSSRGVVGKQRSSLGEYRSEAVW